MDINMHSYGFVYNQGLSIKYRLSIQNVFNLIFNINFPVCYLSYVCVRHKIIIMPIAVQYVYM